MRHAYATNATSIIRRIGRCRIREFGCRGDLSAKPGSDGGRDFGLAAIGYGHVFIDVKTARKPKNLLVEVGKAKPLTIYVLAGYEDVHDSVMLIGWEWGWKVLKAPTGYFSNPVLNHFIPARELRSIDELHRRLLKPLDDMEGQS